MAVVIHTLRIMKTDLFNGRQVFNEMNDLNLKTYPISIHFIAFKVDLAAIVRHHTVMCRVLLPIATLLPGSLGAHFLAPLITCILSIFNGQINCDSFAVFYSPLTRFHSL